MRAFLYAFSFKKTFYLKETLKSMLAARSFSSQPINGDSPPPSPRSRRRRRHSFDLSVDDIPSFQDFQHQIKVRALYRQYLRTISPLGIHSVDQRMELLQQIRHEFRKQRLTSDSFANSQAEAQKRAISEGTRRLKELGAMLGTTVPVKKALMAAVEEAGGPNVNQLQPDITIPENPWPWQR
ncbi:hypothetical protein MPSEU_000857100 [Mayamaea pseudoterrestris]|nr:hypothetical protein MPSEU_000857100 [Mayamaea pseudoterrestris]